MKTKRISKVLFLVAVLSLFVAGSVSALDFPTKPINIVCGFAAGGATDLCLRVLTGRMSEKLGVPVVVINKPGSGGTVAGEFVARSKPDGYTISMFTLGLLIRQTIDPKMTFDIFKDFEPICKFVTMPMYLTVKGDSKFKTVDDLFDFAKKNPGKIIFAHSGIGAISHWAVELFKSVLKIDVKSVPFSADTEAFRALMGGHIDACYPAFSTVIGSVKSGDARVLAVLNEKRTPELPDVPSIKERGYPDLVLASSYHFLAPAGTPKEIVAKLDNALRTAIKDPESQAAIKKFALEDIYNNDNIDGPTDLRKYMRSEYERFEKIAKAGLITIK